MMNINKVKHEKCNWSSDTSLYLQPSKNVLNAYYVAYSPKVQVQRNQHFKKSLIISNIVYALQLNFL